jgi:hypothetical protein
MREQVHRFCLGILLITDFLELQCDDDSNIRARLDCPI